MNRGSANLDADSANPLIVTKPGTYYLKVYEATGPGDLNDQVQPVMSKPFKVTGLHMAILKQPADISVGDALVASV